MRPIIETRSLRKAYRLGTGKSSSYSTLRDRIVDWIQQPSRLARSPKNAAPQLIWALDGVTLQIGAGEVVGIVGGNGAGKSTLLKVLSRITLPTSGAADLYGRVGSLLEVGVGFHPELTGRENIVLSGSILGMRRREIARRFDEIVAFAEVERFLDTPVKHYSSGMYVRLAFAVAAHLDPDILIVDEVLSVGDAAFQQKCLGKMGDVSREGRTVLLVSHNMQAIQSLSQRALLLEAGRLVDDGDPASVVVRYLSALSTRECETSWAESDAPGTDEFRLLSISAHSADGNRGGVYSSSHDICIDVTFTAHTKNPALCVGFDLVTPYGVTVLRSYQTDQHPDVCPSIVSGRNRWRCTIPAGLLNAGRYQVSPRVGMHNQNWIVHREGGPVFQVILNHGVSPFWAGLDGHSRPGIVAPILPWRAEAL